MDSKIPEMFGKVAYTAFSRVQDGLDAYGTLMLEWESLEEGLKAGWREAGIQVVKFHELARIEQIKQDGYAGILPNGNIVDRRIHRTAIPIPKNDSLGAPSPRKLPH